MERYGFFDSEIIGYTSENLPIFDRAETAGFFAKFFGSIVSNGVFPNDITNLQVTSASGLNIRINVGMAWIDGYFYYNSEPLNFALDNAHASLKRIDRVIIRLDFVERNMRCMILPGTPSASPIATDITRNANIQDIVLADVLIRQTTVQILPTDITDQRQNSTLCGFVSSLIQPDTASWFNDFKQVFSKLMTDSENSFVNQLTQQQSDYNTQRAVIENWKTQIDNWKNLTITELAREISFNFDNQLAFPGTYMEFENNVADTINEKIKWKATNQTFAQRTTLFKSDGSIEITQKVFYPDGTLFKQAKAVTTFPNGNPYTEVISL